MRVRVILNGNLYLSDSGGSVSGVDYSTGLLKASVKFTADPIQRVSSGQIEVNPYQKANASEDRIVDIQDEKEISCEMWFLERNINTGVSEWKKHFDGKAVRNKRGKTYTYQLKTIAQTTDSMDEDSLGVIPKVFGAVKHIAPKLIDGANQVYTVGGKPIRVYDNGMSVKASVYAVGDDVFGDTYTYEVFAPVNNILGQITVDATSGSYGSSQTINISDVAQTRYTRTFIQATVPTAENIGDVWINTTANNKTYIAKSAGADQIAAGEWEDETLAYDGVSGTKPPSDADKTADIMNAGLPVTGTDGGLKAGKSSYSDPTTGWFLGRDSGTAKLHVGGANRNIKWDGLNLYTTGINITANGTSGTPSTTPGTATRLTIVGGTAPSTGLTTYTRLDFTPTEDGQTHFYIWNTTTNAGWIEVVSIGLKTYGTDTAYIVSGLEDANVGVIGQTSTGSGIRGVATGAGMGGDFFSVSGYGATIETSTGTAIRALAGSGGDGIYILATSGKPLEIVQNTTKGAMLFGGTVTADPTSPESGMVYFNSSTQKLRLYASGAWVSLN